jgi:hypothetical protein
LHHGIVLKDILKTKISSHPIGSTVKGYLEDRNLDFVRLWRVCVSTSVEGAKSATPEQAPQTCSFPAIMSVPTKSK